MKQEVTIIGGGACAIFLSNQIDTRLFTVTVYEKNNSIARKFLVAGQGGLNLTHSEAPEIFYKRYTPSEFMKSAFLTFSNVVFRNWLKKCGIDTKVGSSGRVFPAGTLKPAQVLEMLRKRAEDRGVIFKYKHEWKGIDADKKLIFDNDSKQISVASEYTVFCLGGASWPVTGTTGEWTNHFSKQGLRVNDFAASNCTMLVHWPNSVKEKLAGKPLKNVFVSCGTSARLGELIITQNGIEGSGVYPLSPDIRNELKNKGRAELVIDLKPDKLESEIVRLLQEASGGGSYSDKIKKALNLNTTVLQLLKAQTTKEDFSQPHSLAKSIKALSLQVYAMGAIEDAISTVGGIALDEIDECFELKKLPGMYAIGEMLDYDAPTGGYLLQSCFSMAAHLSAHLEARINSVE